MNGELVVTDDLPGAFASEVITAFANRPGEEFDIALSGGATARACYERLAVDGDQEIDWLVVNFYWGDERCVPPDDPDSNELLVRAGPAGKGRRRQRRVPDALRRGPRRLPAASRRDRPARPRPSRDGRRRPHGRPFPRLPRPGRRPRPAGHLQRGPERADDHPRMTLTYSGIARARLVIFTVAGEAKRPAMEALVAGEDLPAARVRAGRILWLVDTGRCSPGT